MEAAVMFRADFSFSPATHQAERAAMPLSPTETPSQYLARPTTPPQPSVGELAQILDRQTLHIEVDSSYQSTMDDDFASVIEAYETSTPPRISASALRLQRQARARRHCSPSHLKDVSKLVEKMIEEEDQCQVLEPDSSTSSSSNSISEEDEAIDMDYNPHPAERPLHTLSFRRAADRVSKNVAVTNRVRMRKTPRLTKRPAR